MLGHEDVLERLVSAINNNTLSHAYLFEGIAGVGKFQMAKLLAKYVLCETQNACGHCAGCVKCDSDNHPDVLIIEAEGVSIKNQQVEVFQSFATLKPNEGAYRVAIIRNAEDMTESAQNRILKVLEEPTGHSLIILTADSGSMVLQTIRSRTQSVYFDRLSNETLIDIGQLMGWEVSAEALAFSDGSASGLERLSLDKQLPIYVDQVFILLEALQNKRYLQASACGNSVAKKREDFSNFLDVLMYAIRDMMFMERESEKLVPLYFGSKESLLAKVGFGLSAEQLLCMMNHVIQMQIYLKANVNAGNAFDHLVLKLQEVYSD